MTIFLVLSKINSGCQWHVGLAYISAMLKKEGHKVILFEIEDFKKDVGRLLARIAQDKPKIIGLTANSHQFGHVCEIARSVKSNFRLPIFVGGVHVVLNPQSIETCEAIDGICVGEGDFSFLELAKKIDAGQDYFDLENFWFRRGSDIIKNKIGQMVKDLDVLPMPDRSIFEYFSEPGKKIPRFIFSRGCPFECTYCCNHAFKKAYLGQGPYVRWRSVDLALKEIEAVRQEHDFNFFKLDDDTFSLSKDWLKEFCQKFIAKNWNLTFECNIRPGTIDEESMRLLKQAGCRMVKIGVESGNADLRKKILNRHFSNEDILKTFGLAKKFGILTFSFNMIGVPQESPATVTDTIKLNQQIRPDFMQVTAFYPYPSTALGDLCFKMGYVDRDQEDSYMENSVLNLPTISKRQIKQAVKNFKFNVYWDYDKKRAIGERLESIKKYVIKNPILHRLARWAYRPTKFFKKNNKMI